MFRRLSSVTSHNTSLTSGKAFNLFVKIIPASPPPIDVQHKILAVDCHM